MQHTQVRLIQTNKDFYDPKEINSLWNDDGKGQFKMDLQGNSPAKRNSTEFYFESEIHGDLTYDDFKKPNGEKIKFDYGNNKDWSITKPSQRFTILDTNVLYVGDAIFDTQYDIVTNSDRRKASLHLFSDGGNNKNMSKYDGKSKVWVISHGMNNKYTDMNDLANAIKSAELEQEINPIIILVDWSGARDWVVSPTNTDEWIRPTAEVLAPKLKEWGIENATELNFAGHSMGTMMINEIAKKLSNNANGMYFLDPPNFLPGTNNFVVDKRPEASNAAYDENNGYDKHYSKAAISRAFTGIKKNGDGNWCGNARLNRTARESISVYFPDYSETKAPVPFVGDDCAIHWGLQRVVAAGTVGFARVGQHFMEMAGAFREVQRKTVMRAGQRAAPTVAADFKMQYVTFQFAFDDCFLPGN